MALAIAGALLGGREVGVRCIDDTIAAIGPDVGPERGDEVLDGEGCALIGGLVNGHTHAAMTLFRGYADDLRLIEWLERHIWPAEKRLVAEDVYWGTRLACAEMIRTGTVRFWDMYWHPEATARAVADSGLRATIGAPLIDGGDPGQSGVLQAAASASIEQLSGFGDRVSAALAPHAIYTVSGESLSWIAEQSRRLELPIHLHVSETEQEVGDCFDRHGMRPIHYLDSLGVLGPRTLLAHAVWLDDDERELVADRGCTLVTNPVANMKLAVGATFDLSAARGRGIAVGLGTDGAGSNNSLDLLADVKQLALAEKQRAGDPAALAAPEALAIARGERAPLLVANGPAGEPLAAGGPADLLLVRLDDPALALGSLEAGLVYAASGAIVEATVVAGRVLMRDGRIEGLGEIIARVRERAERLGLR